MGLLDKFKDLALDHEESALKPAGPAAPVGKAPDKKSIYQNRFNFGVNFGSLFVQEKFIFDRFFPDDTHTELDGVTAYIKENGTKKTMEDLENHWNGYVTDQDWEWLRSKGVTAIRIPIGYWHVNGGFYTKGTPFLAIASVYKNSWVIFKNIVAKAKQYDIGVLVDLHALPGGANTAEHSGVQLKQASFWTEKKSETLALSILEYVADELKNEENVIGLQIVNESEFDNNASAQKRYYANAVKKIRKVDPNLPIIISDGWWTDQWVKWINENEANFKGHGSSGLVIDTHVYRCFSDSDKKKSPEQIIRDLNGDLLTNLSGPADIIVGEYSHVLDGETWKKKSHDQGQLVKQFGNELGKLFKQRANTGSFFWTFKFQHGDGGEWGFVPQVESGAVPIPILVAKNSPSEDDFSKALNDELNSHSSYWNDQNSNENYEHWRFKEGFTTGWADAVAFAKFNGSTIGRYNAWASSRRAEHINHRNSSNFLWEWDQGFGKGIERAQQAIFG